MIERGSDVAETKYLITEDPKDIEVLGWPAYLRPHGRSEGRVSRDDFGWWGWKSWKTQGNITSHLNRAQAAQAVWKEGRDG